MMNHIMNIACCVIVESHWVSTHKEFSERIGRERSYISRLEKGETDLQLSSFIRIAAALGIILRLDVNLV